METGVLLFSRIVQCYVNQISLNYLPRNVLRGIERLLCLILPRKSAFMGDLTEELSQIFYNIAFIAACTPFFLKSGDRTSKMFNSRQIIKILFAYTPYSKNIGV